MDVQLTADQKAFAQRAVETGRLHGEEDAVREALALWEERERERLELILSLEEAKASILRGEGRSFSTPEELRAFAEEIKQSGRARLSAKTTVAHETV